LDLTGQQSTEAFERCQMIADSSTLMAEMPMRRLALVITFTVTLMCGLASQAGAQFSSAFDRTPGCGIITFDRLARTITFANWPRWVAPKAAGAKPYPGWPITVRLEAGPSGLAYPRQP
jgi:hypothetical protein